MWQWQVPGKAVVGGLTQIPQPPVLLWCPPGYCVLVWILTLSRPYHTHRPEPPVLQSRDPWTLRSLRAS